MIFQKPAELRLMKTGKLCCFLQGMFSGRDHQEQQVPNADGFMSSSDFQTIEQKLFKAGKAHIRLRRSG